jgi:CO/xanthine dehydrogenase Mo-binding subunit
MSRLDVWDKVNGSATFGTDNFVPGMVYASIARPPAFGAKVTSWNQETAEKMTGVSKVVTMDRGSPCAQPLRRMKGKKPL